MKKLIIGTSLALVLASPAFAATHHVRASVNNDAYASDSFGATNGFVSAGPAVYSGGEYLGWDPDAQIRQDLIRQGNQTQEGGN
jgi:hypothetical protein